MVRAALRVAVQEPSEFFLNAAQGTGLEDRTTFLCAAAAQLGPSNGANTSKTDPVVPIAAPN
jgi:hypothetical protein